MKTCWLSLLILGAIFIISSSLLLVSFPTIYDFFFELNLRVSPGSFSYNIWHETPIPMYMKLYYFNVTNSDEVAANKTNVKPIFEELGPYTFEEFHFKGNEDWTNETVGFNQVKYWIYRPDLSVGSLDDIICNINMVAASASEFARQNPDPFYTYSLNEVIRNSGAPLFLCYSVNNYTFEGIYEEIFQATETFPIELPIPFDKFGWFYSRNMSETYDGTFTMTTGWVDIHDVGQITLWNNATSVPPHVFTDECAVLSGSAGDFFPPEAQQTSVDFFTPDLCRSITFTYEDKAQKLGVDGYKYVLGPEVFGNETFYPDNSCFNPDPQPDFYLPNGLLNVSSCKFNAPAYVSYPHFLMADEALLEQFGPNSIFNPDPDHHMSHLSLEPSTGVPMEVLVRMQINGLIRPVFITASNGKNFTIELFDDLEPMFWPLIWFETSAELNQEFADLINLAVWAENWVPIFAWIGIGLGSALTALSLILLIFAIYAMLTKKSRKNQNNFVRMISSKPLKAHD